MGQAFLPAAMECLGPSFCPPIPTIFWVHHYSSSVNPKIWCHFPASSSEWKLRNWGRQKTRKGAEVSPSSPIGSLSWQRQAPVQLLASMGLDNVAQLLLCILCVTAAPVLFSKLLCQFTMHVVTYSALIWLPFCFSETMIVYGRAVMCCQHRLLTTCWQWPNIAWDTVSLWNGLTMLRL